MVLIKFLTGARPKMQQTKLSKRRRRRWRKRRGRGRQR